ncbi:hypothetical protein Pyrde_0932 [Pyrodictium delaneyi]|uniref:Winged helix-turn-helix transcriptional regulator n=2 Tax=Pyrodictium delaneyi TaxID=1273541 RepID=A0A0P0N260_9CREN|nr:winged helix-turn-helix transcriptional regulator [Pyrodictium delaneyi]ALL00980.1 hypothetical protein Pyrde_0932 [Pyrodictium delaneyi]
MQAVRSRVIVVSAALLAVAMIIQLGTIHAEAELTNVPVVTIGGDGVVTVEVKGYAEPGLNEYPAPVPAIPATIEARLDGEIVPAIYSNNSVFIATSTSGNVSIRYIADVAEVNGILAFNITYDGLVKLYISPGVVLLDLPQGLVNATSSGGALILYVKGPSTVQYIVAAPAPAPAVTTTTTTTTQTETTPTTTTTATVTATATTTPTETTTTAVTTTTSPPQTQETTTTQTTTTQITETVTETETSPTETTTTTTTHIETETTAATTATMPAATSTAPAATAAEETRGGTSILPIVAVIIVVAAIGGYMVLRRGNFRSGGVGSPASLQVVSGATLDDVDRLILRKLREHGGSMLQSQLLRETGIPKTTLWRHVRRLAEQGYIKIEKEGKSNRLTLVREPPDENQRK